MSVLKKNNPAKEQIVQLSNEELATALVYNANSPERPEDVLIDDGERSYQKAMAEIDKMPGYSQESKDALKELSPRDSFLKTYARLGAKSERNPVLYEYSTLVAYFDWKIFGMRQEPIPEALKKLHRNTPEENALRLLELEGRDRGIYLLSVERRKQLMGNPKVDTAWVIVIQNELAKIGGATITQAEYDERHKKQ